MTLLRKTLLFSIIFFVGCQNVEFRRLSLKKDHTTVRSKEGTAERYKSRKEKSNINKSDYALNKHAAKTKSLRKEIIIEAKKYVGIPYKYGGKKVQSGFDCSGFSTFVFRKNGIDISGSSVFLAKLGEHRTINQAQSGDLAFFGTDGKVTHVAIVEMQSAQSFRVIHSTSSKGVISSEIKNSDYWMKKFLFARDILSTYNEGITGLD